MRDFFNLRFFATLLCGVVALFAQSCEEHPAEVGKAVEIECTAGDTTTVSFSADGSWHLSSDAVWCKFVTFEGLMQDMTGSAGNHTITLKITDENNGNNWSTANITIRVGDAKSTVATIKRKPTELSVKICNEAEQSISAISLGYIDWVPFYIEANFDFATTQYPEWVEWGAKDESGKIVPVEALYGTSDKRAEGYARIICDGMRERYTISEQEGNKVLFSNESGDYTFAFPLIYNGMGDDKLSFSGPTEQSYDWEVSLDGKEFRQTNQASSDTAQFSDELMFKITAQDDEYNIIYLEKRFDRGILSYEHIGTNASDNHDETKSWMHFDKQRMTLTIDEGTTTRHGLVLALPQGVYNSVKDNILGYMLDKDTSSGIEEPIIVDEYQKFIIIELTQHDLSDKSPYDGLYIYHSITTHEILAAEYNDTTEEYTAEEIFVCPFVDSIQNKKPGIVVDPRIENWTTLHFEAGNATAEVYHKGDLLKISENEYYLGENKDENMALYLWGPNEGWDGECVYIIFKVDGVAKKLLVVTPPAN